VTQTGWTAKANSSGIGPLTISSGQTYEKFWFGNFKLVTISGYKFEDVNGNHIKETGEGSTGLAWTITLEKEISPGVWSTVATIQTDPDNSGYYEFIGIGPGTYRISENPNEHGSIWIQTSPTTPGGTLSVTTASGQDSTENNFGNFALGIISGYKWWDDNGDGTWDPIEAGLAGWTITLEQKVAGEWTFYDDYDTQDSSGDLGYYEFTDLQYGTYRVSEALQPGWAQTWPSSGTYEVNVESSTNVPDQNFGNWEMRTWLTDTSDQRIPVDQFNIVFTPYAGSNGIYYKISATNPGGFYFNIVFHVRADPIDITYQLGEFDGYYFFATKGSMPVHAYIWTGQWGGLVDITNKITTAQEPGLREGTVRVSGVPICNYVLLTIHCDFTLKGTNGYTFDNKPLGTGAKLFEGRQYVFTANGDVDTGSMLTAHAKIKKLNGASSAGLSLDQTYDETTLAGVTFKLYDSGGKLVGFVTTDVDGFYLFSNLKAGTYRLEITLPQGYTTSESLKRTISVEKNGLILENVHAKRKPVASSSATEASGSLALAELAGVAILIVASLVGLALGPVSSRIEGGGRRAHPLVRKHVRTRTLRHP
jgi:hypothetical protein